MPYTLTDEQLVELGLKICYGHSTAYDDLRAAGLDELIAVSITHSWRAERIPDLSELPLGDQCNNVLGHVVANNGETEATNASWFLDVECVEVGHGNATRVLRAYLGGVATAHNYRDTVTEMLERGCACIWLYSMIFEEADDHVPPMTQCYELARTRAADEATWLPLLFHCATWLKRPWMPEGVADPDDRHRIAREHKRWAVSRAAAAMRTKIGHHFFQGPTAPICGALHTMIDLKGNLPQPRR